MSDWLEIHALADGELDGAEKARVEERLKTCDKSRAEYLAIIAIKKTVNTNCKEIGCQDTWKRCQKRIAEIDRTHRAEYFVGKYAWGLCAMFFLVIMSAATINRANGSAVRAGDVARISSSLIPISAPKSQSADEKERWVQNVLDHPLPFHPGPIRLMGGASGYMDGRKVVRMNLEDGEGPLMLFVVQQTDRLDDVEQMDGHSQYFTGHVNNTDCIAWTDHDQAFLLIGNRAPNDLAVVADRIYAR